MERYGDAAHCANFRPAACIFGGEEYWNVMTDTLRDSPTPPDDLSALVEAAETAGRAAARFFRPGGKTTARIRWKGNNSPVTEGDLAADAAAKEVLRRRFPGVPVLSEEDAGPIRLGDRRALIIDPVDGTRAFMTGRSEWCVSLALMEGGRPLAGVIAAPARRQTFAAWRGRGAFLNGERLARRPEATGGPLSVSGPNRLVDTLLEHWPPIRDGETLKALAYRLASVALGAHDVALATIGANHWDIAAADVILGETGCVLRSLAGAQPVYNDADPLHPALIAAEADLCARLIAAVARKPG